MPTNEKQGLEVWKQTVQGKLADMDYCEENWPSNYWTHRARTVNREYYNKMLKEIERGLAALSV